MLENKKIWPKNVLRSPLISCLYAFRCLGTSPSAVLRQLGGEWRSAPLWSPDHNGQALPPVHVCFQVISQMFSLYVRCILMSHDCRVFAFQFLIAMCCLILFVYKQAAVLAPAMQC